MALLASRFKAVPVVLCRNAIYSTRVTKISCAKVLLKIKYNPVGTRTTAVKPKENSFGLLELKLDTESSVFTFSTVL